MAASPILLEFEYESLAGRTTDELAALVRTELEPYASASPPGADEPEGASEDTEADEGTDEDATDGDETLNILDASHLGRVSQHSWEDRTSTRRRKPKTSPNSGRCYSTCSSQQSSSSMASIGQWVRHFSSRGIPFPVVALVDAPYAEQVFQLVINQKAEPIKAEFLSAIISSSLSAVDVEALRVRLDQAGVNIEVDGNNEPHSI